VLVICYVWSGGLKGNSWWIKLFCIRFFVIILFWLMNKY
jgi:hypothetical protein